MRFDVGGEERSYSMILTRGDTGSDLTGWWKVKRAPEDMTEVWADQAILSVTHIDGQTYTQPEESRNRSWPTDGDLPPRRVSRASTTSALRKTTDRGRVMVLHQDTGPVAGTWMENTSRSPPPGSIGSLSCRPPRTLRRFARSPSRRCANA